MKKKELKEEIIKLQETIKKQNHNIQQLNLKKINEDETIIKLMKSLGYNHYFEIENECNFFGSSRKRTVYFRKEIFD